MPSEILRSQLFALSEGLKESICLVNPETIQKEHDLQREQLVAQYLRQERKEHIQLLYRKAIIEQRKERIENERNAQVGFIQNKVTFLICNFSIICFI